MLLAGAGAVSLHVLLLLWVYAALDVIDLGRLHIESWQFLSLRNVVHFTTMIVVRKSSLENIPKNSSSWQSSGFRCKVHRILKGHCCKR